MSKAMRLTILLLLTAFSALVLKDTVIWNYFTPKDQQQLALKSREDIRDFAQESAKTALADLRKTLETDAAAPVPAEYSYLIEAAKQYYEWDGKPLPSSWTLANVLGSFPKNDNDRELLKKLETAFRDKVLALKATQGSILKLGLDLQGGMSVTIQADLKNLEEKQGRSLTSQEKEDAIGRTLEILTSRIDSFGLTEPQIKREPGGNRIFVDIPGEPDKNIVDSFLRGKGSLSFNIVDDAATEAVRQYVAMTPDVQYDSLTKAPIVPAEVLPAGRIVRIYYKKDAYGLDQKVGPVALYTEDQYTLDGQYIESAEPSKHHVTNQPIVSFKLNPQGAEKFAAMTRDNVNKSMAVVMDDKVRASASIRQAITGGNVMIEGFSQAESEDLAKILRTGALPVQMVVQSVESIGASLGKDAVQSALQAGLWAMITVIAFMLVYYKGAGLNAIVGLAFNMFFLIAILAGFKLTLTMTSIAGLILTIGMAVDANVIIFERIKEEYLSGKSPSASIRAGYDKAFWTILDSNITTLIASILLSFMGKGPIQGFGITLSVGVITSMFSALFLSRFLYDFQLDTFKSDKLSITWRKVPK